MPTSSAEPPVAGRAVAVADGRPAVRRRRSARWCTAVLEIADPFAGRPRGRAAPPRRGAARLWWPVDTPADELAAALVPLHHTSLGPLAGGLTLGEHRAARPAARARLRDPAGRRRRRDPGAEVTPGRRRRAARPAPRRRRPAAPVRRPAPRARPRRPVAARLPVRLDRRGAAGARPTTGRATSSSTTRPTGSARPTSRSPRRPTPATGWSRRCCTPTTRSRRCSTSWSCTATCAGASPATTRRPHLGGVLYLYVRGMCGPETPEDDGHPAGVFSWQPPAALVDRALRPAGRCRDDPAAARARGPARPAAGPRRRRTAAHLQRGRRARRRRRPRRASGSARWPREDEPLVALAVAFVVRAVRGGSVCVDLGRGRRAPTLGDCRGPTPTRGSPPSRPARWSPRRRRSCGSSSTAASGCSTSTATGARRSRSTPTWSAGPPAAAAPDEAVAGGGARPGLPGRGRTTSSAPPPGSRSPTRTTVLTGGPGTGKTTTVAALLALCAEQAELAGDPAVRIALAAPTGKAAARLQQAVEDEVAKLPGRRPGPAGRRPRRHPAPAARLAPGHLVAVPAPPRQPAAARRRRRRRDLDGRR